MTDRSDGEVFTGLGELRGEIRALIRAFEEHGNEERMYRLEQRKELREIFALLTTRVSRLERWRSWVLGALAAVGTMVAATSGLLKLAWFGFFGR